jgi:apolipoprotein D and lipocalin family protein
MFVRHVMHLLETSSCSLCVLLALPFLAIGLFGCAADPPLEVVREVDLTKYAGLWYEIASIPVRQQKGCSCTSAQYSLNADGDIVVTNRCKKPDGWTQAEGKAFVVEGSNNAKLRVQFFWPFRGDYWIIDLDKDYRYAVVGMPSRKYMWILSRTPKLDETLVQSLLARCAEKGYDISRVQRTVHDCN